MSFTAVFQRCFQRHSTRVSRSTVPATPVGDASADLRYSRPNPVPPRIAAALQALREGRAVVLQDDHDRENEADLIVAAERLTLETMALFIRECSGIVCLCLPDEKIRALDLPPMTVNNESRNHTAFTVSIEARDGVVHRRVGRRPHHDDSRRDRGTTRSPPISCGRATCFRSVRCRAACSCGAAIPRHGRSGDARGPEAGRACCAN